LKMPEQLIKFCVTETSHGKQKLRMLFDLIVGKQQPLPLEEDNRSTYRVLNRRIRLR
jgi:hypothetical protein